jgi:hypothetical protein
LPNADTRRLGGPVESLPLQSDLFRRSKSGEDRDHEISAVPGTIEAVAEKLLHLIKRERVDVGLLFLEVLDLARRVGF